MKREVIISIEHFDTWERVCHEAIRLKQTRMFNVVSVKCNRRKVQVLMNDSATSLYQKIHKALQPTIGEQKYSKLGRG